MAAANKVLSGIYEGSPICFSVGRKYASIRTCNLDINPTNCKSYELVNADSKTSATSAVGRAALGAALLGPVGLVAGLTAKKKKSYMIKIEWNNGGASIIEVDDDYYKKIVCAFV